MNNKDLFSTKKSFAALKKQASQSYLLSDLINGERLNNYSIQTESLAYHYFASLTTDDTLECFSDVVREQSVFEKYDRMLAGDIINLSEQRAVSHHQLRRSNAQENLDIHQELANFVQRINDGDYQSIHNESFETVVQIGIGGSFLGPRMCCHALQKSVSAKSIAFD